MQSGIRASGETSLNYYVTDLDNLSLSFEATDNNEDFIGEVHFENCAYKKNQIIESDLVNYEISDFVGLEDGWYGECQFYVTDNASNRSESHKLGDFILDCSPPQEQLKLNIGDTNNQKPICSKFQRRNYFSGFC